MLPRFKLELHHLCQKISGPCLNPQNLSSTPKILAKEMDHFHCKQLSGVDHNGTRKKTPTPSINPVTGLEIKKNVFISVPGLSEEFRTSFHYTSVEVIFKGNNTVKSILMSPKGKGPLHLKQNVVYKWSFLRRTVISYNW